MQKQTFNKMLATIAVCSIGFLSVTAYAVQDNKPGPLIIAVQDHDQRQLTIRLHQEKRILKQAEAAKGDERQKLMDNHMNMLHETMEKMQAMKPKSRMTMQEHEDWLNEYQKLMEDMMGQMIEESHMVMEEHHLMMGKPVRKDDKHKH